MFNLHLPDPLYEQLPRIYLLAAAVLAFLDLSPLKWVAVVALALAAWETGRRRRAFREAQRLERLRGRVAARYGKEVGNTS